MPFLYGFLNCTTMHGLMVFLLAVYCIWFCLTAKNTKVLRKERRAMTENEISHKVIGLAMEVHTILGPGLLESAYKECLWYKINQEGLWVDKEKPMPLVFENVRLECGYRIDLLVENKLVIEIKSVEALNDVHFAQTLTYMKLGNYRLGLLMNFNVFKLKDGIKRIVNGL